MMAEFGLVSLGGARPRQKQFLSEKDGITAWTWWPNSEVGHNQEATKELSTILGSSEDFNNPKPTRLIQRVLQIASDGPSLILDSFAGSGTTAHAVLKQNLEDKGARNFILVEMEPKIARDITAERVRRVIEGYTDSKGNAVEGLGGGFQYCRLSEEPLFDSEGLIRPDVTFAQLAEFIWFRETGTGFDLTGLGPVSGEQTYPSTPLLGVHEGRGIYLLYNGILKDRSDLGGNVLNRRTLDYLNATYPHDGQKVIYASRCRYQTPRLRAEGVEFKQLPYRLTYT